MNMFKAKIGIIGINPFVFIPSDVLNNIFEQAGKSKGNIPVRGKIDGQLFIQTLLKYSGYWRLYLNTEMRKSANKEVGQPVSIEIEFDPIERIVPFNSKFKKALKENAAAKENFDNLSPSLQKEILRYLSYLKKDESIDRNVQRAVNFLLGKERFLGRDRSSSNSGSTQRQ